MKNSKRSEITQRRIQESAVVLFAEQGYNAAGVAEICAAAQVSKGAFYHHFPGKSALFISLLEEWLAELDTHLNRIAAEQTAFPEKLAQMGEMIAHLSANYQKQIPMLMEFWMQASRDEEVWQAVVAPFHRYQQFFAALIQEGIHSGHLEPVDPQAGARTLISLAIGLLLQYMLLSRMGRHQNAMEQDEAGRFTQMGWEKSIQESIQMIINSMRRCA